MNFLGPNDSVCMFTRIRRRRREEERRRKGGIYVFSGPTLFLLFMVGASIAGDQLVWICASWSQEVFLFD